MSDAPNPHDLYAGADRNDDEGKLTRFKLLLQSGHSVSASLPESRVDELYNRVSAALTGAPGAGAHVIVLPKGIVALAEVVGFIRITADR